jgi:site-specific recombinase XerC
MMRQAVNYLVAEIGKRAKLRFHVHPHMLRRSTGYYTTWKVSSFAGRQRLCLSGWHQHLQHFIAGFTLGKIPLA